MITKDQAEMLRQLCRNVVRASGRYDDVKFSDAIKEKRLAWEEMANSEKAFNKYVDNLVAQ